MIKLDRLDDTYIELYERLGGAPVLERALTALRETCIRDPKLAVFFTGIDPAALQARLIDFCTMAYGGPNRYDGPDLRDAFAPARAQGLTDDHLGLAITHFGAALAAQGIAPALIEEAEAYLHSMRDDVLGR